MKVQRLIVETNMKIQVFNWNYDENSKPPKALSTGKWISYDVSPIELYDLLKFSLSYFYIRT